MTAKKMRATLLSGALIFTKPIDAIRRDEEHQADLTLLVLVLVLSAIVAYL